MATADTIRNSVMVLPMVSAASSACLAPVACPIRTVAPIAKPTAITVSMCMAWLPTDTAVMLPTPLNCPTTNKSAIPYRVCRK